MATHPKQITIYVRHKKTLISLALLPVYLLGDERLVKQLLWDNKLGASVSNGIVNANVSITALVASRGRSSFENTYNRFLYRRVCLHRLEKRILH